MAKVIAGLAAIFGLAWLLTEKEAEETDERVSDENAGSGGSVLRRGQRASRTSVHRTGVKKRVHNKKTARGKGGKGVSAQGDGEESTPSQAETTPQAETSLPVE